MYKKIIVIICFFLILFSYLYFREGNISEPVIIPENIRINFNNNSDGAGLFICTNGKNFVYDIKTPYGYDCGVWYMEESDMYYDSNGNFLGSHILIKDIIDENGPLVINKVPLDILKFKCTIKETILPMCTSPDKPIMFTQMVSEQITLKQNKISYEIPEYLWYYNDHANILPQTEVIIYKCFSQSDETIEQEKLPYVESSIEKVSNNQIVYKVNFHERGLSKGLYICTLSIRSKEKITPTKETSGEGNIYTENQFFLNIID